MAEVLQPAYIAHRQLKGLYNFLDLIGGVSILEPQGRPNLALGDEVGVFPDG